MSIMMEKWIKFIPVFYLTGIIYIQFQDKSARIFSALTAIPERAGEIHG